MKRVAIVGSGNWGSALAKLIGENVAKNEDYENEVRMWVFEEMIEGKKLTEIINADHENVKYLPGVPLPENIRAESDIVKAVENADYILFVLPHQFVERACMQLLGKIKPTAVACSAIKGLHNGGDGTKLILISQLISELLKIECGVLMGANIANEVARGKFCETTLGFKSKGSGNEWKKMVQTNNFRVVVVEEVDAVELCGALKNIIAFGAGIIDGLYHPTQSNTKAAVIRLGLMEIIKFCESFYPGCNRDIFLESCGIADMITSCFGGRNRRVGEAFGKDPSKSVTDLERELLNGQRLQGPLTASELNAFLRAKNAVDRFPLMTAIHLISEGVMKPSDILDSVRNHPEHMDNLPLLSSKPFSDGDFLKLREKHGLLDQNAHEVTNAGDYKIQFD